MTQPFKVCARCGQRAVPHMPQCGRCGLPFPPATYPQAPPSVYPPSPSSVYPQPQAQPAYGPALSAASQRELQRAASAQAALRRRGRILATVAALVLICLAAVGIQRTLRGLREIAGPSSSLAGAAGAAGDMMNDPTGGLFHERPSSQEQPMLTINNGAFVTLTLMLRGGDGKEYSVSVPPFKTGRLQVPAGGYYLIVSGTGVDSNTGDANFRRFKEYDATFVLDMYADPIHLGD